MPQGQMDAALRACRRRRGGRGVASCWWRLPVVVLLLVASSRWWFWYYHNLCPVGLTFLLPNILILGILDRSTSRPRSLAASTNPRRRASRHHWNSTSKALTEIPTMAAAATYEGWTDSEDDRSQAEEVPAPAPTVETAEDAPSAKRKNLEDLYSSQPKKRKERPSLKESHLIGPSGLLKLPNFIGGAGKPSRSLHSAACYAKVLMQKYNTFFEKLEPGLHLNDCILAVEKLGSKRSIKDHLGRMRHSARKTHVEKLFGKDDELGQRLLEQLEHMEESQVENSTNDEPQTSEGDNQTSEKNPNEKDNESTPREEATPATVQQQTILSRQQQQRALYDSDDEVEFQTSTTKATPVPKPYPKEDDLPEEEAELEVIAPQESSKEPAEEEHAETLVLGQTPSSPIEPTQDVEKERSPVIMESSEPPSSSETMLLSETPTIVPTQMTQVDSP